MFEKAPGKMQGNLRKVREALENLGENQSETQSKLGNIQGKQEKHRETKGKPK